MRKTRNSRNYVLPIVFKRYTRKKLTLGEDDNEQIKLANESNDIDTSAKPVEKRLFLINLGLFLHAREKVFNKYKNRILPIKDTIPTLEHEPAPKPNCEPTTEPIPETAPKLAPNPKVTDTPKIKRKIWPLKLCKKFLNDIQNEENHTNNQIFK